MLLQKKAWPSHKPICQMTSKNRCTIETRSLSEPLTTGVIASRAEALKDEIRHEYANNHFSD